PVVAAGLQLDVHGDRDGMQHFRQSRDALATKRPAEPCACIERAQLGERPLTHRAMAIGRALEREIVHYDYLAVAGQLDVELDHPGADLDRAPEGGERVLRADPARTPMGDDDRRHPFAVGPRVPAVNVSGRSI